MRRIGEEEEEEEEEEEGPPARVRSRSSTVPADCRATPQFGGFI